MSKRLNFGQLKEVIQPPNLIENQVDSYKEFLQMDVAPSQRETVGLEAVFSEVFPIESYDSRCHLEYVSYNVTPLGKRDQLFVKVLPIPSRFMCASLTRRRPH